MIDLKEYGLDSRSRRARMKRIGVAIVAAWRASASESGLKSTLREYKRGVQITESSESHVIVTLRGELPNLLERGIPPHDMRNYLLRTVRTGAAPIRRNKEGKPYRYIMFRRSVSDIKNYGFRGAYAEAKSLSQTMSQSTGKLLYGSRMPAGRASHFTNKSGIRSVSDALSGMVRLSGNTTLGGAMNRGANTTYATWRTVSWKRPDAWQHSGFEALDLALDIELNLDQIVNDAGL
jgi:hypothetical protein